MRSFDYWNAWPSPGSEIRIEFHPFPGGLLMATVAAMAPTETDVIPGAEQVRLMAVRALDRGRSEQADLGAEMAAPT